ncbi:MAG TPA: BrnT family toxin [Stellaceae bacterium]|nr:BrnT family toxin [Stellaceae bacterium]
MQAFGKVNGRTITVIFTWRGRKRRIISARKANLHEQRFFEEAIQRR